MIAIGKSGNAARLTSARQWSGIGRSFIWKNLCIMSLAIVALAFSVLPASADDLSIQISDGTSADTYTVTDGSNTGMVMFDGAVGAFSANVTTAFSQPLEGSALMPQLDLNSVDVTNSSSTGGTLTIEATDTNYIGSDGVAEFFQTVGGTQNAGNLAVNTYLDCSDSPFGQGTLLTSQSFSSSAFSGSQTGFGTSPCGGGGYSLTEVATLQMPGNSNTSFDANLSLVSEPSTLLLFGTALFGVGLVWRRKLA